MERKVSCTCGGYLTVYLALVLAVLLSLYLALIEGARSGAMRLEAECVMDIGLNSVLAEYHRELFDRYNLFVLDSSYGTTQVGSVNVEGHLETYLNRNFSLENVFLADFLYRDFLALSVKEIEMTKMSILSDHGGAVFRTRAVEAVKDDVGLGLLEDLKAWMETVEINGLNERDLSAERAEIDREIQGYDGTEVQISEEEWAAVEVSSPTEQLNAVGQEGILKVVAEDPGSLSAKGITEEGLIAFRMARGNVSQGTFLPEELSAGEGLAERFLFQEYLLKYMGQYEGGGKQDGALSYQIEYLIAGEETDMDNLRKVANILCGIREVANLIYLYSDQGKCAEAETLAAVIAAALLLPEITPLLKQALLFGWAYAESLWDVKMLLKGEKVPLLKDSSSWHCGLEGALRLSWDTESGTGDGHGLSYEDYLRLLMSFTDLDTLTARAMNMVEADIRLTAGNSHFRLDACYDWIEMRAVVESAYGYEYEITRQKKY